MLGRREGRVAGVRIAKSGFVYFGRKHFTVGSYYHCQRSGLKVNDSQRL